MVCEEAWPPPPTPVAQVGSPEQGLPEFLRSRQWI